MLFTAALALLAVSGPVAADAPTGTAAMAAPAQNDGGENDFLPPDRDLTECVSALPKPGCGSEARGGWRQTAVFLAVLGGLGFIAWRVIAGARAAGRVGQPAHEPSPPTPSRQPTRKSEAGGPSEDAPTPPNGA